MRRLAVVALLLVAMVGCQQKTEQRPAEPAQTPTTSQAQQDVDTRAPRPAMKQSDARVWIDPITASRGSSGSFKINFYGVEPMRAIVVPLTYPQGMRVDSISFAGGILEYLSSRPTRIENDERYFLMTAIPMSEPDIPAVQGYLASVYYTLGADAVSGEIDETFIPPGNYLSYVDTTTALLEIQFEPGKVTVQ
jgi:hypothetical protein